jgi:tRNA1(Val) A37 N6-methylase TrmN6
LRDSFYTSNYLADILVNYVTKEDVKTVADFCVGGGELLRSAQARWKNIDLFGIDICQNAISKLEKDHPDWNVECCDFLNEKSLSTCSFLDGKSFDLILLNPPFTCKGSTKHRIEFDSINFNVSTAMQFLLKSIRFLSPNGILVAILPISAAYSQKDLMIWKYLEQKFHLTVLEERDKQYFKACYPPNIVIVSLNDFSLHRKVSSKNLETINFEIESIIRGRLSMHEIIEDTNSGKFLIHTTNLIENEIVSAYCQIKNDIPLINGPGVLIQRVGSPLPTKICLLKKSDKYIISDCLIFIKTPKVEDAKKLKSFIFSNWQSFQNMYKGTGAKYITIDRLKDYFRFNDYSKSK